MATAPASRTAPETAAVPAASETGDIDLTREYAAPRDLVWRAWTEPERVARWWGPRGFTNPRCEVDARAGGAIRIDMRGPDGTIHPMAGTFREVLPPERLVFVASALDAQGRPLFETLNTITFAAQDGRTSVRVQIGVLTASAAAAPYLGGAREGWTQQMERLAGYVGPAPDPDPERAGAAQAATTFTLRSDLEVVARRTFSAPPWLVFLVSTRPAHFARWSGPRGFTNTVHEMDVRPGGAWRVTQRAPDGAQHPFAGVYREVAAPERLVYTQRYLVEPLARHEMVVATTFAGRGGATALETVLRFASAADRAGALGSGMEQGVREGWDRLAAELERAEFVPETPWPGEIVGARVLAAPRDLVWSAWTEPERLARWWGPRGFRTATREMDLRPGGAWRFVMQGPDGTDYDNEMIFEEVLRPARLVYEHTVAPRFRQEVTFEEVGGGTRVAVRSTFASAGDVRRYAVEGMGQHLERLEGEVAGGGGEGARA